MTIQLRIKLSDEIKNLLNDDIYKGAIERYVTVSQSDNEAFEAELAEVKLSYRQRQVYLASTRTSWRTRNEIQYKHKEGWKV
jgi:hypothetical protein